MKDRIFAPLQLYTTKELAALYRMNVKTMRRWLRKHRTVLGEKPGHAFSIFQVEIIFGLFGWPMVDSRT